MKSKLNFKVDLVVLSIILIGAASRFLPHPPNFTAIGAIALFGGAYFSNRKIALILPLVILFISDLAFQLFIPSMGFHKTMPFVYGSFLLITVLGFYLREKKGVFRVAGFSLISSLIFFTISNFGSWLFFYPVSWEGLTACYLAAIPFFHYNILGDLLFNGVFFTSAWFVFQKSVISASLNE